MKKLLELLKTNNKIIYFASIALCLTPWTTAPFALFLGLLVALTIGAPYPALNKKVSKYLLQASVVGLGFGMNLTEAIKAGSDGILFTVFSVVSVMIIGVWLGKRIKVQRKTAYLVSGGTAICGGSAIAAIGPVIKAESADMSVSLATVFILNAVALFIFPVLGHWMHLTQHQFGLWSAIAIHDTSSVVGAASSYGEEALKTAVTVKLTRALWIIPLAVFTSFYFKIKNEKVYIPWFIFLFILAMVINSFIHIPENVTHGIVAAARKGMTVTLFFIGLALSRQTLREVGMKPVVLGVILWFFISVVSLIFISVNY